MLINSFEIFPQKPETIKMSDDCLKFIRKLTSTDDISAKTSLLAGPEPLQNLKEEKIHARKFIQYKGCSKKSRKTRVSGNKNSPFKLGRNATGRPKNFQNYTYFPLVKKGPDIENNFISRAETHRGSVLANLDVFNPLTSNNIAVNQTEQPDENIELSFTPFSAFSDSEITTLLSIHSFYHKEQEGFIDTNASLHTSSLENSTELMLDVPNLVTNNNIAVNQTEQPDENIEPPFTPFSDNEITTLLTLHSPHQKEQEGFIGTHATVHNSSLEDSTELVMEGGDRSNIPNSASSYIFPLNNVQSSFNFRYFYNSQLKKPTEPKLVVANNSNIPSQAISTIPFRDNTGSSKLSSNYGSFFSNINLKILAQVFTTKNTSNRVAAP